MRHHYLRGVGVPVLAGAGDLSCTPGNVLRRWALTSAGATRPIRGRGLTVFIVNRRQKRVSTIRTAAEIAADLGMSRSTMFHRIKEQEDAETATA